ncbi:MAG: CinA family protein [bacterium JZ-2024 1]
MKTLPLLRRIAKRMVNRGWTLSVAESCTGGMLGQFLSHLPGSSRFFLGGIIAYSAESKVNLLSIDPVLINEKGTVNEEVARKMALGAKTSFRSDWALSTTGVAGPDPANHHPPGTIFIGLASPHGHLDVLSLVLPPASREKIRKTSVVEALHFLLRHLEEAEKK